MDTFDSLVEEYSSRDGVINLFGVILYNDKHPSIKKVLRDIDYWQSLHQLTGDSFCVFSVKPPQGHWGESPRAPSGTMGILCPIWKEANENEKLIEVFGLNSTRVMPLLLLFTKVEDEYWTIEIPIDDSSIESSYNSIKDNLETYRDALDDIKNENFKNSEGVYAAVKMRHDHLSYWKKLEKTMGILTYLKRFKP